MEPGDDVDVALAEPLTATGLSPFAVASFATALLAVYSVPSNLFPVPFLRDFGSEVASKLVGLAIGHALGGVALWLARNGGAEIGASDGRLGGVGSAKAGRVLSVIAIVATLAGVIVQVANTGQRSGAGVIDVGPDAPGDLPPDVPPPPAAPAAPGHIRT